MSKTIKIVQLKVGQMPVVHEVEHGLNKMREMVGGYIEMVRVTSQIDLWLNEEGKLDGLPFNFALAYRGNIVDEVVGDVFFASHDDEGDTVSLTNEMIHEVLNRFLDRNLLMLD